MTRIIVALGLLFFVFFGSVPKIDLGSITIDNTKPIISIEKPSEEILNKVKPISDLINDREDRVRMALFNYELAERINGYNTDSQQLNDLYTNAGSSFFGGTMKGKYPKLSTELKTLFESVITDENHVLTTEEKQGMKDVLRGLSWDLLERQ